MHLLEFNVHAITAGIDALGEVTVRFKHERSHPMDAQSEVQFPACLWRPRCGQGYHRRQRQGIHYALNKLISRRPKE